MARLLATLRESGFTVYCNAEVVHDRWEFSLESSVMRTLKILDKCKYFVMLYTSSSPSSILVEAGYVLTRKIPTVYIVKEGIKLPFLLNYPNLEYVEILDFEDSTEIEELVRHECTAFFSR